MPVELIAKLVGFPLQPVEMFVQVRNAFLWVELHNFFKIAARGCVHCLFIAAGGTKDKPIARAHNRSTSGG